MEKYTKVIPEMIGLLIMMKDESAIMSDYAESLLDVILNAGKIKSEHIQVFTSYIENLEKFYARIDTIIIEQDE